MVVTVEPGCYFIPMMFTRGAKEWGIPLSYVDMEKVNSYMKEVSGVRIEDDIIITETGMVNYVKVPRTCEEIETCMAGGDWEKIAKK